MLKKITALLLALVLALCCCSALAETTKHERVYLVTSADGTVRSLTDSIHLENTDSLDQLADRSLLENIQNMSGDEPFTRDGEALLWQAGGRDITYQGTAQKAPALLPVVTLTLDGQGITAEEMKDKTGDAVLTVRYQTEDSLPALAVSILPLPAAGITDLKLENAAVFTEMGRQVLVGWAVPGMDTKLGLPASFSAAFHADHADLSWMLTLATSDPINLAFREISDRFGADAQLELREAQTVLTAVMNGTALPETTGKTKDIIPKLQQLNEGLTQLDDGAVQLAEGAKALSEGSASLKTGADQVQEGAAALAAGSLVLRTGLTTAAEGAASLDTGLAELTQNNEALNNGATRLQTAVLETANAQIAASGLSALGITLPALTAENYAEALDAALAQLDPEVLGETARLPAVQSARESLTSLKAQLDQVNEFVTGLKDYTDGAAQAAAGAATLNTGLAALKTGAVSLNEGAAQLAAGTVDLATGAGTLSTGAQDLATGADTLQTTGTKVIRDSVLGAEKSAALKLIPVADVLLPEALRVFENTRDRAGQGGYDLRPEGMQTVTVYIIRTDL